MSRPTALITIGDTQKGTCTFALADVLCIVVQGTALVVEVAKGGVTDKIRASFADKEAAQDEHKKLTDAWSAWLNGQAGEHESMESQRSAT